MPKENKKAQLKRNFISLNSKIQILDRLKKGEKISCVARSLNLNEATIRTIKKNEQKIRTAVAEGSPISKNLTARSRALIIEKMEKALSIWIDNNSKQRISLDGNLIKQKALQIYNHLKENGESPVNPEFVASKGWFERFKNRFFLHNIRIQGESVSADYEVAKKYPKKFKKIIEKPGCKPHEVVNVDETDNWWKIAKLEDDNTNDNSEVLNFTLESIWEGLNLAEQLESYFLNTDPLIERSTKFKKDLQKCLAPYHEIYKDLSSKQTNFLKRTGDVGNLDAIKKNSKDKGILQEGKYSCLIKLDGNKEEKN